MNDEETLINRIIWLLKLLEKVRIKSTVYTYQEINDTCITLQDFIKEVLQSMFTNIDSKNITVNIP